jgi:hypothetical protein
VHPRERPPMEPFRGDRCLQSERFTAFGKVVGRFCRARLINHGLPLNTGRSIAT